MNNKLLIQNLTLKYFYYYFQNLNMIEGKSQIIESTNWEIYNLNQRPLYERKEKGGKLISMNLSIWYPPYISTIQNWSKDFSLHFQSLLVKIFLKSKSIIFLPKISLKKNKKTMA